MPFRSEAQRKALYAAAGGHSTLGISQAGAKKFIAHAKAEGSPANLPEHVAKRKRRLKAKRKKRA